MWLLLTIPRQTKQFSSILRTFHSSRIHLKIVPFNLADIGEGITECELLQWFVKEGNKIQQFDRICEVQSDKATVEITSRFDGIIKKLHYKPGEIAKVGFPLVDIESNDEGESSTTESSTTESASKESAAKESLTHLKESLTHLKESLTHVDIKRIDSTVVLATPAVRRMARELEISLDKVKGTGKSGRIMKEDLLNHHSDSIQPSSTSSLSSATIAAIANSVKSVPLTPVQKAMVKSMQASLKIPHFGYSDEFTLDRLSKFRQVMNQYLATSSDSLTKMTFMPFFLKAFSIALLKFPILNSKFEESSSSLLYRSSHNIGVAIDSPAGLVVPNISNVQDKSIYTIATELQSLTTRAQQQKLQPSDFQNTTITISNIGNIGGTGLHPVIPPDTVCIAAIGKSMKLMRWDGEAFKGMDVVNVSFSADHRIIDGATVARFFKEWKNVLENPETFAVLG